MVGLQGIASGIFFNVVMVASVMKAAWILGSALQMRYSMAIFMCNGVPVK